MNKEDFKQETKKYLYKFLGLCILDFAVPGVWIALMPKEGERMYNVSLLAMLLTVMVLWSLTLVVLVMWIGFDQKSRKKMRLAAPVIGRHFSGLPITQNAECKIMFDKTDIIISSVGSEFTLAYQKIYDIELKSETEIQKQYVSSVGGAAAGAVLFGVLGAMIGGRVKEVAAEQTRYYMMIAYNKNSSTEYIAFEIISEIGQCADVIASVKQKGLIKPSIQKTEL